MHLFLVFPFLYLAYCKIYIVISSDGSMHILKPNGHMETRALCEQINKNAATETQVIVHQTTGW